MCAVDFDARDQKLVDQIDGLVGIVLGVGGDQDRVALLLILADLAFLTGLDGVAVDVVDLVEKGLAAIGCGRKERVGGDEFVVDDVAEGPPSAEPGTGIFGARENVARGGQRFVGALEGAAAFGLEVGGAGGGAGGRSASSCRGSGGRSAILGATAS